MTFIVAQKFKSSDGSTTSTGSTYVLGPFTNSIGAGDAILGGISYNSSNVLAITITDDASPSNSYPIVYQDKTNGVLIFALVGVVHAGGKNLTFNFGTGGINSYTGGIMIDVTGASAGFGTGGIDKTAHIASATGTSQTSGATATLSQSGEFLYCLCMDIGGGTATTYTAGTNVAWTLQNNAGTNTTAYNMADETFFPYNSTTGIAGTMTNAGNTDPYFTIIMTLNSAPVVLVPSPTSGFLVGLDMVSWTPMSLRNLILGGGSLRLGEALRRNVTLSRRAFLTLN